MKSILLPTVNMLVVIIIIVVVVVVVVVLVVVVVVVVASTENRGFAYKVLVGRPEGKKRFEDRGVDGRKIPK
jgi:flagellar basal body-associated protein FliL